MAACPLLTGRGGKRGKREERWLWGRAGKRLGVAEPKEVSDFFDRVS